MSRHIYRSWVPASPSRGPKVSAGFLNKLFKDFSDGRGEAHRFIILAPTGTAAALLNGFTYHSVLGITDSKAGERHPGIGIQKVRERLCGVVYIFLNEISMVSCESMYKISAKLGEADLPLL
jgi:hypothetical protein